MINVQCSGASRSFARQMRALYMRNIVAGHQKLTNAQWRAIIEADPLTTTREIAKELSADHSMVIQHLGKIGKVKKLDKWLSHGLTMHQKNRFEVSSYSVQQ